MKQTHTAEERLARLQGVAKAAGGKLLSKKYIDSKTFYEWKCAKGHTWKATPNGQGKTRWCPTCGFSERAFKKTQTTEEVNLRLSVRGVKLAGKYDPKIKIQKCTCLVCNKPTTASLNRIPKGYGCKACLRKIQPTYKRNKVDDLLPELKSYQVTIASPYTGVSKPMLFKCNKCGVEFSRSIDNLRRSKMHLCKELAETKILQAEKYLSDLNFTLASHPNSIDKLCSILCNKCGSTTRITLSSFKKIKNKCKSCENTKKFEKIKARAKDNGGELLTKKYLGVRSKYEFKCSKGHIWTSVPLGKSWCPKCAGKGKDIEDIRRLTEKRGGRLISTKFIGVDRKYEFRCSLGHEFSMTFAKMQAGQWCSICSKGSKSEELVRVTMEQIFGVKFKRVRPSWLKNDLNVPMELDGYSTDLEIAFEYQGRQHYEEMSFLQGHDLKRVKRNDRLKSQICAKRGVSLFIFTYEDDYRDFPIIAKNQSIKFGIDTEKFDFAQEIDFEQAYIRTDKLEELVSRAATKRIKVLSKKWLGVEHHYKVQCEVCLNKYEVAGSAFMSSKINGCRFCSLKRNYNKSTLSIDVPSDYAKRHKGKLLDSEYRNMHTSMNWKCKKGHEFQARFNNLVRTNQFCPICEGRTVVNRFDQDSATKKFKEFDLDIQGKFQGMVIAVPTKCRKCKNINSSRLSVILKGSPPCLYCSGQRIDEKTAFAILNKCGLKPLSKYVNTYFPILCKCLTCGLEKNYKVLDVKATNRGCSHKPKR